MFITTSPNKLTADLISQYKVTAVADLRMLRKYDLESAMKVSHLDYKIMETLLDVKRFDGKSDKVWNKKPFRVYAEFMRTQQFKDGIQELYHFSRKRNIVILQEKPRWWCGHVRMICDQLHHSGLHVIHVDVDGTHEHKLPKFANTSRKVISYDHIP